MDPNLNKLLKWSLQHQSPAADDNSTTTSTSTSTRTAATLPKSDDATAGADGAAAAPRGPGLDAAALASVLLNAPSDAEMMQRSMQAIRDKTGTPLPTRLVAWDNLEQLVENLDNANLLENLRMWPPLREELQAPDVEGEEIWREREYAAWCVGTSVQNNRKSQDALLSHALLPVLTRLALADPAPRVRKKACFALSSAVRNHQPATDELVRCLRESEEAEGLLRGADEKVDAADMERISGLIADMRARIPQASSAEE
ncbi:hsp70 nucleotide exchange factor fes1 [Ascosphaera acerosa]|nr:hsp70 nucleotide exchange factor fes1 [Ascosphaera acerosa]